MLCKREKETAEKELRNGFQEWLWDRAFEILNRDGSWARIVQLVVQRKLDPFTAVHCLGEKVIGVWSGGRGKR